MSNLCCPLVSHHAARPVPRRLNAYYGSLATVLQIHRPEEVHAVIVLAVRICVALWLVTTLPDQFPDAYYSWLATVLQIHRPEEVRAVLILAVTVSNSLKQTVHTHRQCQICVALW